MYSVWVQGHPDKSAFLSFLHLQTYVDSTILPSKMLFTATTKDKSVVISFNIIAYLCFLVKTILWTSNPFDIAFGVIENRELYSEKNESVLFSINVSCVQMISYHVFSATMISKEFLKYHFLKYLVGVAESACLSKIILMTCITININDMHIKPISLWMVLHKKFFSTQFLR